MDPGPVRLGEHAHLLPPARDHQAIHLGLGQVEDLLVEKKASYQTTEGLEKSLRSQIILFAVTGGLMALGTVFYQRGKPWARFIGMFVAGFIAVMYVMQVVQGALNIPGLAITFASVAAIDLGDG